MIWQNYFEKIQLYLEKGEVTEIPPVLSNPISEPLSSTNDLHLLFAITFKDDFENLKANFIKQIKEANQLLNQNQEFNQNQALKKTFIQEICKLYSDNFLIENKELIGNFAVHFAKEECFGMKHALSAEEISRAQDELQDGRIYQLPEGGHTWRNNVSWLLAHIHKGHSFFLFSELNLQEMKRLSEGHEEELSGFARQIALLTKLRYQFELSDSSIKLLPPVDKNLIENLTLQDAIMENAEVEKFYTLACQEIERIRQGQGSKPTQPPSMLDIVASLGQYTEEKDSLSTAGSYVPTFTGGETKGGVKRKEPDIKDKEKPEEPPHKKPNQGKDN